MSPPARIQKLDEAVVNRIAAGEIIQRPANALKELLENALDAKATNIQIQCKDGGLKLLQIQDNGSGIVKEDLDIVCERFTTSKLKTYDDLSSIATYGFRGEALASISHVAHLTIVSKTADSPCAYRALYRDGLLAPLKPGQPADPKPCAANTGTQITVEDLFYNVSTRRKAFKNLNEEYHRILEVVTRYAIHNSGIGLSCRKTGSASPDIQTTTGATTLENIRQVYGAALAKDLVPLEHEEKTVPAFKIKGYLSNANVSQKKLTFLLFINHRLVESSSFKRVLENAYAPYLAKGSHPWVYLSLEMPPHNVDVNVHPTKREVHFLYEEDLLEKISALIQEKLQGGNTSRTFLQPKISTSADAMAIDKRPLPSPRLIDSSQSGFKSSQQSSISMTPVHKMVRTDSQSTTLDSFVKVTPRMTSSQGSATSSSFKENVVPNLTPSLSKTMFDAGSSTVGSKSPRLASTGTPQKKSHALLSNRVPVEVRLTSVLELRQEMVDRKSDEWTQMMRTLTWVGLMDGSNCLVQHETKLLSMNLTELSRILFYQLALKEFHNYGVLEMDPPVPIQELLEVACEDDVIPESAAGSKEDLAVEIMDILAEHAPMLQEYFNLKIDDEGNLLTLPLLLAGYSPLMGKLPFFLMRLGTEVDWSAEKPCFQGVCEELACFFSAETCAIEGSPEWRSYQDMVHQVVFPALKQSLLPATGTMECQETKEPIFTELADLPDLYKVFERC